jgi:Uma2 family endonuclease
VPSRSPVQVDPNDPRAPSEAVWISLTEEERVRLVEQLPAEVSWELSPPEGDRHRKPKARAVEALDTFFRRMGRSVYVSSELAVYYPDEPRFAPDLLAVLDVPVHDRDKWVVSAEGKGLDFVLEVLYHGDPAKDLEENVVRYARLGIGEYFVFDRGRGRLHGFALTSDLRTYQPLVPQAGRWASKVLGLALALEVDRVRFYAGSAPIPELEEIAQRAETLLADAITRKDETERLLEQARERAELAQQEARQAQREAEQARQEAADLRARLERLERERRG